MIAAGLRPSGRQAARLAAAARAPGLRRVLRPAGLALLVAGAAWAVAALDIEPAAISPGLVLVNLLLLAPLTLLLAALALRVTAAALGREIALRAGLQTAAAANLAELLPLPGGAILRGAALVQAGASPAESGRIVVLTALLTLAMTATLAGAALAALGAALWAPALALGLAGLAASATVLARQATPRILLAMVALRLATLAVSVLRLWVAFAMLGLPAAPAEAALYTLATTLGSTVAIVPGGFGVNETIAAGLALLASGSPAAAFLAVAANRAVGLVAGAGVTLVAALAGRARR